MDSSKKTIRTRQLAISWLCTLAVLTVAPTELAAQSASNDAGRQDQITTVVGQSQVIRAPWRTVRVSVTDPEVANVQILTPEQVLLQGVKVGSTDLILWHEDETKIWQVSVHVTLDVAVHQQKLLELFPRCELELDQSGDVLLVKGLLRSADQAAQLREYLETTGSKFVDMTSIAGVQQVQLQVRVAEVTRAATRALGINALLRDEDYFLALRPGSDSGGALVPSAGFGPPGGSSALSKLDFVTPDDFSIPSSLTVLGGIPAADLEVFLQALAENQYLRILANPTLVALSGEEASFLAGGEFPIPVVQSGRGGAGGTSITIEYKEFGVRLTFRPTVLGDGTIRLYASPEVSELTTVGSVTIEGFVIPAVTTRRAETTLELKSGQTFAMAGLIRSNINAISSKIPGIGDIPIIGPLFRSVRYAKEETELVVLVTAVLVEPLSVAQMPPLPGLLHSEPNDWELYMEGRIEGREPAKIHSADADWLRQMGLDDLTGPGAWDYYGNPTAPSRADAVAEPVEQQYEYEKYEADQQSSQQQYPWNAQEHELLQVGMYATEIRERGGI